MVAQTTMGIIGNKETSGLARMAATRVFVELVDSSAAQRWLVVGPKIIFHVFVVWCVSA